VKGSVPLLVLLGGWKLPAPHWDPWAHLTESANAAEEKMSAAVATAARARIFFTKLLLPKINDT
jgi:hypothetical protein